MVTIRVLTMQILIAVLIATLALLPGAHAADNRNLAPNFTHLPQNSKILLLPIDIELGSISAGGVVEPKADWTQTASNHMTTALREQKEKLKLQLLTFTEAQADPFAEVLHLQSAVMRAIANHHFGGLPLPTKEGKLDWEMGPNTFAELQKASGADYGLFIFVRDTYASAERKAMMIGMALLGIGISGGVQVGFASLVDLRTGRVVWFSRLARSHGDLREIEPARESVSALMSNFPKTQ